MTSLTRPGSRIPYLDAMPAIAVLRGVRPDEISLIAGALFDAGFRIIEVPLNSPQPIESVRRLAEQYGDLCLVGAGTVCDAEAVARVADAGGRLIVLPHCDVRVIEAAKKRGLVCLPGVATPTEAFAALAAGADGLKMFPAEQMPPPVLKAWRAVLPEGTSLIPVGGINANNVAAYWEAGAAGFGTGSSLYRAGASAEEVFAAAATFVAVLRALPRHRSTASNGVPSSAAG